MEKLHKEICEFLYNFENATDDEQDGNYLSDGQWLDEFYVKMLEVASILGSIVAKGENE